jgi:hypothetical protein
MAHDMRAKLDTPNYREGTALMRVPETVEGWRSEHRTARKRVDRSARLGYTFAEIDRSLHAADILEINLSLSHRQGRPMTEGYRKPSTEPLPDYQCSRHNIRTYGVLQGERLRAYLTLYRLGELRLISMILGHGEHLKNDVMYALFQGVVEDQAGDDGWFYYNRWDSGTDGLRYFKSKLGFAEGDVEWGI